MNSLLTDKITTLNRLLDCAVLYNEHVIILKNGEMNITFSVNVYADVREFGFSVPVIVSSPNQQTVIETVDLLIDKIKESKVNG
jgi:hypothetical protein